MRLVGSHGDVNSTRIMPRDPPVPPPVTADSPSPSVGHVPRPDCAASARANKSDVEPTRNDDVPSSSPKRLTDSLDQSQSNRKRSKRSSTRASGDRYADQESRRRVPPEDALHPTDWVFERAEGSHPGISEEAIRNAISLCVSAPQSRHLEPAFDGHRSLGDQALLNAERYLRHHPLHLHAAVGGEYNWYNQRMPSRTQSGFGSYQMDLAPLHHLRAMSALSYPDMLGSLSDFGATRHDNTVPISFLTGGFTHGVLLEDIHILNPAQQAPFERLRAQSGFVLGPTNTPSNAGFHRGTSHETNSEVDNPDVNAPHSFDQAMGGKPRCFLPCVPARTSVELFQSPPSSSTTSYSGEMLLPRDPSQTGSGNPQVVASAVHRAPVSLGIDEDVNWLSEFHCYVRCELVEVFQADRRDCKVRNFNVAHQQVGIRCRFCAHRPSRARALRSAAYPSSIAQIYQSFTMMLRDHFPNCDALPRDARIKFMTFREIPAQGATDSKRYWIYAARKLGMVDSSMGIQIDESVMASEQHSPPFGTPISQCSPEDNSSDVALANERDRNVASEFLILLMKQARVVHLLPSERLGSRRNLPTDLVGFSCRYCCEKRRLGQCRMFPSRRRTLPGKVSDLYDHLQRCFLCPASVKQELMALRDGYEVDPEGDDLFFDQVWRRLGHES